jgi:hypothetical protein
MTTTLTTTKPARQGRTKKAISPREQQRREFQSHQSKRQALAVIPEYVSPKIAGQLFGMSAWSARELVRKGLVAGKRYGERRVLVSYAWTRTRIKSISASTRVLVYQPNDTNLKPGRLGARETSAGLSPGLRVASCRAAPTRR